MTTDPTRHTTGCPPGCAVMHAPSGGPFYLADAAWQEAVAERDRLATEVATLRAENEDLKQGAAVVFENARLRTRLAEADDLLMTAWGVIANANEGDWSKATDEWRDAAVRWRDRYHALLAALGEVPK